MNTHFGMTSQKITDCLGLMRAQVIADDMHGLLLRLACDEIFQKRDELCTGVAGARLTHHLPPGGVERRPQPERALGASHATACVWPPPGGRWQQNPPGPCFVYA